MHLPLQFELNQPIQSSSLQKEETIWKLQVSSFGFMEKQICFHKKKKVSVMQKPRKRNSINATINKQIFFQYFVHLSSNMKIFLFIFHSFDNNNNLIKSFSFLFWYLLLTAFNIYTSYIIQIEEKNIRGCLVSASTDRKSTKMSFWSGLGVEKGRCVPTTWLL